MAESEYSRLADDRLWVLARLKDTVCAVDGTCVEGILVQEGKIIELPSRDNIRIGAISLRGGFVPVIDLRVLMGMRSYFDELDDFVSMMEQRKQDHIRWVDELKRCVQAEDKFTLATDPHQCAFGKWYDGYKPTDPMVAMQLRKIEEPHRRLHESAELAFLNQEEGNSVRTAAVYEAEHVYMPRVVGLLEESKQTFRDSYRQMMVAVGHGGKSCALLVDEVLSAEPLSSIMDSKQVGGNEENPLVTHIAQRKGDDSQILVLNLERLFQAVDQE